MHSHSQKRAQFNTLNVNVVRLGLSKLDSLLLNRESDHRPKVQRFVSEDDYDEEPEQREYFCTVDISLLDYHKYLDIWVCPECFQQYDPKIQDTPIKDKSKFKLFAHPDHNPYATLDEDDPYLPFIESIDPNREPEKRKGYEVTCQSSDKRIEHRRVKDMSKLTEALKF